MTVLFPLARSFSACLQRTQSINRATPCRSRRARSHRVSATFAAEPGPASSDPIDPPLSTSISPSPPSPLTPATTPAVVSSTALTEDCIIYCLARARNQRTRRPGRAAVRSCGKPPGRRRRDAVRVTRAGEKRARRPAARSQRARSHEALAPLLDVSTLDAPESSTLVIELGRSVDPTTRL